MPREILGTETQKQSQTRQKFETEFKTSNSGNSKPKPNKQVAKYKETKLTSFGYSAGVWDFMGNYSIAFASLSKKYEEYKQMGVKNFKEV